MLNAIYHFDMGEAFSPYAGYGISTAFHEASLEGFSDGPHRAFAYQSKVEIGLNLSQNMGLLSDTGFSQRIIKNRVFYR